ncbi:MAG: hypothetical protein WDN06_02585 [Asticcacaulis sp.]
MPKEPARDRRRSPRGNLRFASERQRRNRRPHPRRQGCHAAEGAKVLTVAPSRLAQNNRQGRKIMQSYFKKRGVTVEFAQD